MRLRAFYAILPIALCVVSAGFCSDAGERGYDCYFKNDLRGALASYRINLNEALRSADNVREVICLNNLATVYYGLANLDSAAGYIRLAKAASQANPSLAALAAINEQLLFFPSETTDISADAVEDLEDLLSAYEYASVLIGWGRVKLVRNEPNEALSLFEKAQKKLKKGKNPLGLANVAYYTARALKAQGEAKDALKQADEGERLYRIKNHVQGIKKCLVLKEALYRSLSDTQQADDIKRRINNLR